MGIKQIMDEDHNAKVRKVAEVLKLFYVGVSTDVALAAAWLITTQYLQDEWERVVSEMCEQGITHETCSLIRDLAERCQLEVYTLEGCTGERDDKEYIIGQHRNVQ